MNRRLTILMCADLVGYSALMGRDEALAVASVRELKTRLLEPVAANHGGEVLKRMGDGWILSFPGVEAALDCAEEVQTGLADHAVIKLRIGCHIGEIVEDEDDFYGAGVNIAQRIETEAPPGGVMLSEDLFRQLSVSRRGNLADAGVFKLKNIATPMRLYQWRPANLVTAPGAAGALPSIGFEPFSFAPDDADTAAIAADLHDGILQTSMKRTGIDTVDLGDDPSAPTVFILRGRLRLAGARGRLAISLILREDVSTVWTSTYDGNASDIFAFTDDVVARAEADIRLQTIQHDGDRMAHLADDQLSLSELRARAANLFFKQRLEDWRRGYAALERAVTLNPRDPMALAMKAQNRLNWWGIRFEPFDAALAAELGRELDIAVQEEPHSDFIFWARAAYRLRMLDDLEAARFDMAQSLEVNPNFLGIVEVQAQIALREGRIEDALKALEGYLIRGSDDPFKLVRLTFNARAHLCAGNAQEAAREAKEAAYLRPEERGLHLLKALACREAGDTAGLEAARRSAEKLEKQPCIAVQRIPLPDGFEWINDALHPEADPV
ncbi:adenylate/guanylate cyclase domain-containing protein [Shimia sp. W99]